jgi:hypothetical protein
MEKALGKMIEVVPSAGGIGSIIIDVPGVREVVFAEVSVQSLTDIDQAIPVPAGEPEEFKVRARRRRDWGLPSA